MRKLIVKIKSYFTGVILGIIAAVVISLAGCGKASDDENQIAAPEIESIDDEGNVIDDDQTDKDYLQYMSESELKELSDEALDAAGKNDDLATGEIMTFGINFDPPEGFEADEDYPDLYVTERYPIDASSVSVETLDVDYTLQLMDSDKLKSMMEADFLKEYEKEIEINITEYEETEVDGIPAFRIKLSYTLDGYNIEQLIYMINGTNTYVVTYTQTDEYDDRMEAFEESAATIKVRE